MFRGKVSIRSINYVYHFKTYTILKIMKTMFSVYDTEKVLKIWISSYIKIDTVWTTKHF
jgi:hypothetical protein